MTNAWTSFWIGTGAALLIAVIAGIVLSSSNPTAQEAFSTQNTRL